MYRNTALFQDTAAVVVGVANAEKFGTPLADDGKRPSRKNKCARNRPWLRTIGTVIGAWRFESSRARQSTGYNSVW